MNGALIRAVSGISRAFGKPQPRQSLPKRHTTRSGFHAQPGHWARSYFTSSSALKLSHNREAYGGSTKAHNATRFGIPSASHSRLVTLPNKSFSRAQSRRSMFIRTETTPNPDSMKFIPDKMLLEPGQSMNFPNAVAAVRSPLAKMLFRNEMVQGVFIGSTFVTVTKDEDSEWDEVKSIVFADLMEFLSSGEPVLLGEMPVSDTTILPDDSEDVALIKTLIETRIRPSIQDDGGDVIFKGFIDGVVFLQLQGACTSCSSSSVTLKNGVEKMLKHWSSSVISVVAIESEEEWERIRSGQPAASTSEASSGSSTNTDKPSSPENESFNANQNKSAKVEDL